MTLPGQAWGLAAAGPNGPVFATSYRGRDVAATVLTAVDAAGLVMWQRDFEGHPGPPRVSATGTVWVAHRDDAGHILAEVNSDNAVVRSIRPEQHLPGRRTPLWLITLAQAVRGLWRLGRFLIRHPAACAITAMLAVTWRSWDGPAPPSQGPCCSWLRPSGGCSGPAVSRVS